MKVGTAWGDNYAFWIAMKKVYENSFAKYWIWIVISWLVRDYISHLLGNILYIEDGLSWQVRPIDFEYASYSYR